MTHYVGRVGGEETPNFTFKQIRMRGEETPICLIGPHFAVFGADAPQSLLYVLELVLHKIIHTKQPPNSIQDNSKPLNFQNIFF